SPKMRRAVVHVPCSARHSGLLLQSESSQSMSRSWSSSRSLLHCSNTGAQFGAKKQAGSAQSTRPLQSSSLPPVHTSTEQPAQLSWLKHEGSAQSTLPSQSSSNLLLQISALGFVHKHSPRCLHSGSAQSTRPSQSSSTPLWQFSTLVRQSQPMSPAQSLSSQSVRPSQSSSTPLPQTSSLQPQSGLPTQSASL